MLLSWRNLSSLALALGIVIGPNVVLQRLEYVRVMLAKEGYRALALGLTAGSILNAHEEVAPLVQRRRLLAQLELGLTTGPALLEEALLALPPSVGPDRAPLDKLQRLAECRGLCRTVHARGKLGPRRAQATSRAVDSPPRQAPPRLHNPPPPHRTSQELPASTQGQTPHRWVKDLPYEAATPPLPSEARQHTGQAHGARGTPLHCGRRWHHPALLEQVPLFCNSWRRGLRHC